MVVVVASVRMLGAMTTLIPFDNAYVSLPPRFYAATELSPVTGADVIRVNAALATQLGIDPGGLAAAADVLAGNRVPEGAQPIAQAYAGHQFGGFSPSLGDGRAVLLGQLRDRDGQPWDVQLKGSGPTRFSRGGDGRAWIGPVLREYVLSEAMHALGIPTTRALAATTTGEPVYRQGALPGAVLTRVARSHVRVGTFEYFAARSDREALELLLAHVLERYMPDLDSAPNAALALLAEVGRRQAELVAGWVSVGFIHGVMNTDNSSVVGDTLDYGPCAFMDAFEEDKVFSSIDHGGRYAYGNQGRAAHWNLAALARALAPLFDEDKAVFAEAQTLIDAFPARFDAARLSRMRAKLGLAEAREGDDALVDDLLGRMDGRADFTNTFRALGELSHGPSAADDLFRAEFDDPTSIDGWLTAWRARLGDEGDSDRQARMRRTNPALIARNHRVEAMIQAAVEGDYGPLDVLMDALADPFTAEGEQEGYCRAPQEGEVVHQTFCGT